MPPNPVAGIAVNFHVTAYRSQGSVATQPAGEVVTSHNAQQVALSDSDFTVYSDGWGQASLTPEFPADWGALRVDIHASISGQAAAAAQAPSFTLLTLPYENPIRLSGPRRLEDLWFKGQWIPIE